MATLPTTEAETPTFHALSIDDTLAVEHVEPLAGLSATEVSSRRTTYGSNLLVESRKEPWWRAFLRQYADPMQIVLLCAGLGSLYPLKQFGTGMLLLVLTFVMAHAPERSLSEIIRELR